MKIRIGKGEVSSLSGKDAQGLQAFRANHFETLLRENKPIEILNHN
jgi:hypothetical protein